MSVSRSPLFDNQLLIITGSRVIGVIFRQSSHKQYTDEVEKYFERRAQSLAKIYDAYTGGPSGTDPLSPGLVAEDVFWTLINNKSSNTDFTTSKRKSIIKLREWLTDLAKCSFQGRVILVLSQVDGFTTNIASWKTVFGFCETLDLWLFFVHEAGRHSLLRFEGFRTIIHHVEQGVPPPAILSNDSSLHEYILTLLFMTGVGVNKRM